MGAVPIPLRRLGGNDVVMVCPLPRGTVGQIVRLYGYVIVQVSEAIPPDDVDAIAQHCYGYHRYLCQAGTCSMARTLAPVPTVEVAAASA